MTSILFEQENSFGDVTRFKKTFSSDSQKTIWIKQMRLSADEIGKYFRVVVRDYKED